MAQGAGNLPPLSATRFGVKVASGPEAFDLGTHQSAQFSIVGVTGYRVAQSLHKKIIYPDPPEPRKRRAVPYLIIKGQPLHVVAVSDLIWCQRIARRGGLSLPCTGLTLSLRDLVLKLRNRARQQLERFAVVTTQRGTQFGPSDDPAQIFRHHKPGVMPPFAIHQVTYLASHENTICNQSCNHEADTSPCLQGFSLISKG